MPPKTAFFYHNKFLEHDTGAGHPERPDRLRAIVQMLHTARLWEEFQHPTVTAAPDEAILAVHTERHLTFVRESCMAGRTLLDEGDTHVSPVSHEVAALAAGAGIAAVDAVMGGSARNAFCAGRPPGHHAERERVMGFCLFNNIAIAARHAQKAWGAKRVAIVDWDVHHGNGTQEIFYNDPSVLFISTHQFPLWPGTGRREEAGEGPGRGFTINIPMLPGSGEMEYLDAFRHEVIPALHSFRPDLILISSGFDAHAADPLASIELTEESFSRLTELVADAAGTLCNGRIVSLLEGGYDLDALAGSAEAHLRVLLR